MEKLNIGLAPGNEARGSGQEIHALKKWAHPGWQWLRGKILEILRLLQYE